MKLKILILVIYLFVSCKINSNKITNNLEPKKKNLVVQTERNLKLSIDSDTVFWKREYEIKIHNFNLTKIENLEQDFIFRFWNVGNLLEIKKTKSNIKGKVTYFVYEVWEDNYKADKFVKHFDLKQDTSEKIYSLITESKISDYPSDKFISNWKQGFDGVTYIYEIVSNSNYSFKHYWTPNAQKNVKEAKSIMEFNDQINNIINIKEQRTIFEKEIPFISYTYPGSSSIATKIVSKQEFKKYKRKRKRKPMANNQYKQ